MLRSLLVTAIALAPIAAAAPTPERWQLVERWRSGGDSALGVTFDAVVDMTRAANGHLLVVLGGAKQQLLIVDNTGRPVGFATGADGLPRRFDKPNGVVQLDDGRIVVNEPEAGRLAVLDERGVFVEHIGYEPWGYLFRWTGFVHDDGGLYEPIVHEGQLVWRRWAPDLGSSAILPVTPCDFGMVRAAPGSTYEIRSPFGEVVMPVPFAVPPVAIVRGPSGSTWTGLPPDYRRLVHTPWQSCEDDLDIALDGEPQAVSGDDLAAAVTRVRLAALGIGAAIPDLLRIPMVHPPFTTLHLDRQQRLWANRFTGPSSSRFSVYGSDGAWLADVPMPVALDETKPVIFGDSEIVYFTTDAHGWVWLVAMRIERYS